MEFLFLLTEGHLNPYFKKILLLKIGTNIIYIDKLKKIILDLSFNYTEKILRIKKGVIKHSLLNSFDPNIDMVQHGFVSMEILGKLFIKK